MDTTEIEVFLVLAEELHFGRTAERLRLPRASRLITRLERRAGGALFNRTTRRIRLTPPRRAVPQSDTAWLCAR